MIELIVGNISGGRMDLVVRHDLEAEALQTAVEELLPLIEAKALASAALSSSNAATQPNRQRAMMALNLKSSHFFGATLDASKNVVALASGDISASQVGFPEFDDSVAEGSYE